MKCRYHAIATLFRVKCRYNAIATLIMAPQSTLNEDTEIIFLALQAFPDGALIDDIEQKTNLNLPRRTLQRRLQRLQATDQIQINGKTQAKALPQADQSPFIEAVETVLLSVHEGNFARFQVGPSVFKAWQVVWRR